MSRGTLPCPRVRLSVDLDGAVAGSVITEAAPIAAGIVEAGGGIYACRCCSAPADVSGGLCRAHAEAEAVAWRVVNETRPRAGAPTTPLPDFRCPDSTARTAGER